MATQESTFVAVVPPDSLVGKRSKDGQRNYWKATDPNGTTWTIWDAQLALQYTTLVGQQALWSGKISPASDPRYGMNYELRALQALNGGQVQQGTVAATQAGDQSSVLPQPAGLPQPTGLPQPAPAPQAPPTPQASQLPSPPSQTLGQGGTFSDSDILRMARSTSIEAVSRLAIVIPDDFKDADGRFDWSRFYLAAESMAKFITLRKHEGWVPNVELDPGVSNEERVIAEVNAEFPGAVTKGLPDLPEDPDVASAENAVGDEVPWD